jgi:hypothetical protein
MLRLIFRWEMAAQERKLANYGDAGFSVRHTRAIVARD